MKPAPAIVALLFLSSPYALVSADDPPVFLFFNTLPAMGQPDENATHSANFGVGLEAGCKSVGAECEFVHPIGPKANPVEVRQYLIERLKAPSAKQSADK